MLFHKGTPWDSEALPVHLLTVVGNDSPAETGGHRVQRRASREGVELPGLDGEGALEESRPHGRAPEEAAQAAGPEEHAGGEGAAA